MTALKSNNQTHAFINKNFVIKYSVLPETKTKLTTARKYKEIVGEELKNKHFKKVLSQGLYKHTFLIRNRLKIVFHSK